MSEPLIQSYVCEKYFVSTIKRRSSALENPMEYYETMWWNWRPQVGRYGDELGQEYSGIGEFGAMKSHYDICLSLLSKAIKTND